MLIIHPNDHVLLWDGEQPMTFEFQPVAMHGKQFIQSYGNKQFRISDKVYKSPVIVFPEVTYPWVPRLDNQLGFDDLENVLERKESTDILLFGSGKFTTVIPPGLQRLMKESNIVLESMGTGAACRTFNVLLGEDRQVVAALLPID